MNVPICDQIVAAAEALVAEPEGISIRVIGTDDEKLARIAGPLIAGELYPDRIIGIVLDVAPLGPHGFEVIVKDGGPRRAR